MMPGEPLPCDTAAADRSGAATLPDAAPLFPAGWPQRLWFAWATVAVPLFCFAMAFADVGKPEWQRPDSAVWLQLLLHRAGAVAFAPLAAVAVLANAAIALRPGPWVASAVARTTLAIGFVYSLQYSLLVPASLIARSRVSEPFRAAAEWAAVALILVAVYAATFACAATFTLVRQRLPSFRTLMAAGWKILAVLAVVAWLSPPAAARHLAGLHMGATGIMAFFGTFLVLFAGPVWTADALGRLLWRLGRPRRWPLPLLAAALGAYLLEWRLAVLRAVEAYEALPQVDTSCFVATAAARGPRWLTGSFERRTADGGVAAVSPQLQRFKLFEIALRELSPRAHRALRRVYDRLGPRVAAWGRTPFRAGLLWLALKPCELLAAALVRAAAGPAIARRARRLYRRD